MSRPSVHRSSLRTEFVPGHNAFKITLLRVLPGHESAVAARLREAIKSQRGTELVGVMKVFGEYDLAAIYRCGDFEASAARYGAIQGILSHNQVLAFPWHSRALAAEMPAVAGSRGQIWGITFYKIRSPWRERWGSMLEQSAARLWGSELSQDSTISVLGSVGWAELIVLIRGKSIGGVARDLSRLSHQLIDVDAANTKGAACFFSSKTLSFICIDFDLCQDEPRLLKSLPEPLDENQGAGASLAVVCAPGDMAAIMEYSKKHIGETSYSFGATDLLVRPRARTWGEFVSGILKMRRKLKGQIYSTRICVVSRDGLPQLGRSAHLEERKSMLAPVKVTTSDIDRFQKWGPDIENHLLSLYYGANALLQDPIIGETFLPLKRCLDITLRELVMMEGTERDSDFRRQLGGLIQIIAGGAQQYMKGTFPGIEHVYSPFTPLKGGIQRALLAMSSVPSGLHRGLGLTWNGFVVVGLKGKGFSCELDVINLPFEFLFHPEEWWGLLHETGHSVLYRSELANLEDSEPKALLEQVAPSGTIRDETDRWLNNFMEVGADLFDLHFCYGRDLDSYLCNIWSYLVGVVSEEDLQIRHLPRLFCAFEYWKHFVLSTGTRRQFPRLNIDSEIADFTRKMSEIGVAPKMCSRAKQEIKAFYVSVRPLIEWYWGRYRRRKPPADLKRALRGRDLRNALKRVADGRVWLGPIRDPHYFILGLKEMAKDHKKGLPFHVRIAAILTLWNTYVLNPRDSAT